MEQKERLYLELHRLYHSQPSAVKQQTQMYFTGTTSSLELVSVVYSFSVAADENVTKLLHVESVMSAVSCITW